MSEDIIRHKSIGQLREGMSFGKPTHPLITIIDTSELAYGEELVGVKFTSDLYCIALKDASCGLDYGRNHYDFDEGVLIFTTPNQVLTVNKPQKLGEVNGWMLYFLPDLIRNTSLGSHIDNYSFFGYDVYEALHLSEQEQAIITQCVDIIQAEINEGLDDHSQHVSVSNLEHLLNYCMRYYQRQFNTRSATNNDVVSKVESLLKEYYESNILIKSGQPTIQYLADLLSKETGRSAKDDVNDFWVGKAKNLLFVNNDTISRIAYNLGFNYSHYFSRIFKNKTGLTPQEYRDYKLKSN